MATGRPKGSKDKSYLTLQHWYNELAKDWPKLKPAQRAKLSAQLMQMLVNKLKTMPSSPEDSVANTEENMRFIESLEFKSKEAKKLAVEPKSDLNEELGPSSGKSPEKS